MKPMTSYPESAHFKQKESRVSDENQNHRWSERFGTEVKALLTPALVFVLGTIVWSMWNKVLASISAQADAQQQIMVQLATIQEQIREGQQSYSVVQSQIGDILAAQRDHEHRLTILESSKNDLSTGRQFRTR